MNEQNSPTLTGDELQAALRTLISKGLTFASCTVAFQAKGRVEEAYVEAARDKQRDGELEIDSSAVVSLSDDQGAYVMAWVWVADSDVWKGDVDSDGEPCLFENHYQCDDCGQEWTMNWSCACDDECSSCGKSYCADESVELDITGAPVGETP